jgi:hypothetical protein
MWHSELIFSTKIRALADVDLWSLPVRLSDGAATGPPYNVPAPVEVRDIPEGSTVYSGSCHCGAVGYTLVSPEKITSATDCDCSICSRVCSVCTIYFQTAVDETNRMARFGSIRKPQR